MTINPDPETEHKEEPEKARRGLPKQLFIFSGVGIVLLGAIITAVLLILNSPITVEEAYEFDAVLADYELMPGETAQITPTLTPLSEKLERRAEKDFSQKQYEYVSDNSKVVTVDESGLITAVAPGETKVTVNFSSFSESFSVLVYIPIENIVLDRKELNLLVDDSYELSYSIEPFDATIAPEKPSYESSDDSVITVDDDGHVEAVGPGEAVLTFRSGEYVQECTVTVKSPLKGIEVEEPDRQLLLNDTSAIKVNYLPANTTDSLDTLYQSSDPAVAAVDEQGNITAVGPGSAVITVTTGRFKKEVSIFVRVPLTGVTMSYSSLTIRNGDSVQLPYAVEPQNTNDEIAISWESDNTGVVQVNQEGVVTAVGPGTANVTIHANDFSASCQITVIIPVTGVAISQGEMGLNRGQQAQLGASVIPANTTEVPYITWSSDNTAVATVDGNGVVTAVGPGTAIITANHDLVGATCAVYVFAPMSGISFTQSSIDVIERFSVPLSWVYDPEDTTDPRDVSFSSDHPEIATVDVNGVVTGVAEGECTITGVCNGFTAVAAVRVHPYIEVESITLDQTSLTFDASGGTRQLHASVLPENATVAGMVWSSSNNSIASVDGNGNVTAVGGGDCVISVTVGAAVAKCSVHVTAPNKVVVLDPGHCGVFRGAAYNGYQEEIVNLKVAYACKDYLESHYAGVSVYLTRYDQSAVGGPELRHDLEARAQVAQDHHADILVSMHFNASVAHNATGALAFVSYQPNVASQCSQLASCILNRIAGLGVGIIGPVATASDQYFDAYGNPLDYYAINRHCANRGIPGIIVEHCFIDTQPQFLDDGHLAAFGVADAQGIADYLGLPAR